jgi:DNA repair protein RecN (Recombination protein N)
MGQIMATMSNSMQLFSITHLPQIAARGRQQYKVFKEVSGQHTRSTIVLLDKEERIMEIARMLSGATVSETAIVHAKALLE